MKIKVINTIKMLKLVPTSEIKWFIERWVRVLTFSTFRKKVHSGIEHFKKGYSSYDYDSDYALEAFVWKLKRLSITLKEENIHENDAQHAKEIDQVTDLLDRVLHHEYINEFEKKVSEKYGDSIHYQASTDGLFGVLNKDKGPFKNNSVARITFSRRENWTPELDKEINKAEREVFKKAEAKRNREWKKALNIIETEFFKWWS